MDPEQQAAEILIEKGFASPEDLEPEIARLLREASRLAREEGDAWMVPFFEAMKLDQEEK